MYTHINRLAFCLALFTVIEAETYHHIGCFMDYADDRDLSGRAIPYSSLQLASCANECQKNGFPYLGMQNALMCYCGNNYGKHSIYPPYKCNGTCTTGGDSCGGVLSNDVYYAVKTDAASIAKRERTVHSTLQTFTEARQTCVSNGGDLALLTSADDLNGTLSLISSSGISSDRIWFGLRRPLEGAPYEWTDATATPYDRNDYASWWKSDETWQNFCVVLIVAQQKWESTSCYAKYPFVCMQDPPQATETPGGNVINPNDEGSGSFDKKKLSLYIVLPMMMFCYGGSCIAYCSAKLWKNCRKQQRKKMLLENEETEYEPHNKPPPPVHRPLSARRVAPMPIHAVPYPLPQNNNPRPPPRPIRTPVQEIQPSTSKDDSPPQTSRPTTSGAIALDVHTSPPPPYYESKGKNKEKATKVREEQRRRLLLDNALKEARGRREKERTLLEGEMETSLDNSNKRPRSHRKKQYEVSDSSGTSPEPMENMEMDEDRPRRKRRAKKMRPDEADSGDSTTDLLADSRDPPKEPTMMSIAEIMKAKLMMNQGRKRPAKRVIQAA